MEETRQNIKKMKLDNTSIESNNNTQEQYLNDFENTENGVI